MLEGGRELGCERFGRVLVGDVAPAVPEALRALVVEVYPVGGVLAIECGCDVRPRPAAWWDAVRSELEGFVRSDPGPLAMRLVLQVSTSLGAPTWIRALFSVSVAVTTPAPETRIAA